MSKVSDSADETYWKLEHDKSKCALCEVCAKNCPTEALRREREGSSLTLYYKASLCDGCGGTPTCEENCPEKAIKPVKVDSPSQAESEYELVVQSEMAQCAYCEAYFAPIRRLDAIQRKVADKKKELERVYCPLCRRTNLVVQFIEQTRVPGSRAEYRAAKDILRKAKVKLEKASRDV